MVADQTFAACLDMFRCLNFAPELIMNHFKLRLHFAALQGDAFDCDIIESWCQEILDRRFAEALHGASMLAPERQATLDCLAWVKDCSMRLSPLEFDSPHQFEIGKIDMNT